jgi:hypothetical protein
LPEAGEVEAAPFVIEYNTQETQDNNWFVNIIYVMYLNFVYQILYFPPLSIAWWSALFGEKEWIYKVFIPDNLEGMFDKVDTFSTFYNPKKFKE